MTTDEALKLINTAIGAEEMSKMVNSILDAKKGHIKRSFNLRDGTQLIQELAEAIASEPDDVDAMNDDDEDDFGGFNDDEDDDDEIYEDDEFGGKKDFR